MTRRHSAHRTSALPEGMTVKPVPPPHTLAGVSAWHKSEARREEAMTIRQPCPCPCPCAGAPCEGPDAHEYSDEERGVIVNTIDEFQDQVYVRGGQEGGGVLSGS
eukprot:GHVO01034519.1.p1 GENE.GHVO01034519.1~~GHVO01034519.1.p1  ORF type:complete len:105 (+),score=26.48 GHVO01034519.1:69-383(+)